MVVAAPDRHSSLITCYSLLITRDCRLYDCSDAPAGRTLDGMLNSTWPSPGVRRAVLAAYWIGIFVLTHWPDIDRWKPPLDWPDFDKLVHLALYGGWALLWCWLLLGVGRRLDRPAMAWLIVGGAAYGVFDELTQAIVGRQPDILDFVLDMVGVLLAIRVATWWQRRAHAAVSSPE